MSSILGKKIRKKIIYIFGEILLQKFSNIKEIMGIYPQSSKKSSDKIIFSLYFSQSKNGSGSVAQNDLSPTNINNSPNGEITPAFNE